MKILAVLISFIAGSGMLLDSGSGTTPAAKTATASHSTKAAPVGAVTIIIDKSDYELSVYDEKGWYATYPVVFGNNSLGDKKMEGDKQTPEGTFHITNKKMHEKWHRFMGIDYPTKESWDRFRKRKEKGEIPANASIGGSIGIHGTWPHEDFVIDKFKNWTMGCISMKNPDVAELFSYVPSGTEVTIRR
ncbi:MAG: murein L,D-transpeptidase [Chitinophagaceae bacterium]|nr:MAG: murein L,D-transpeptidase [Chitinophagaceae bacterium]